MDQKNNKRSVMIAWALLFVLIMTLAFIFKDGAESGFKKIKGTSNTIGNDTRDSETASQEKEKKYVRLIENAWSASGTIAKEKEAGKEFLEDYILSLSIGDPTENLKKIDAEKLMNLPVGDVVKYETCMDRFKIDSPLRPAIGKILFERVSYNIPVSAEGFAGYLLASYRAKSKVDYEKLKKLPIVHAIDNQMEIWAAFNEIFYNDKSYLNAEVLKALDYRISLLPSGSNADRNYLHIYRARALLSDIVSGEYMTITRDLSEFSVRGSQNFGFLMSEKDIAMVDEAEALIARYKKIGNLAEAKKLPYKQDLIKAEALFKRMDASPTFKQKFTGIMTFAFFLAALHCIDDNPEKAADLYEKLDTYEFLDPQGKKYLFSQRASYKMHKALVSEILGDKLAKTNSQEAKQHYADAEKNMLEWSYIRPHYPMPKEFVNRVRGKLAALGG